MTNKTSISKLKRQQESGSGRADLCTNKIFFTGGTSWNREQREMVALYPLGDTFGEGMGWEQGKGLGERE